MPSSSTPPRKPRARRVPAAKFRLRVSAGDTIAVGPGKIALLEAIDRTGSITAAAHDLEMSYRRAWTLLDDLNRSLRKPAVASAQGGQRGGGSLLTDTGRELVGLYRQIELKAARACEDELDRLLALVAR
jgi:molybdate transport system regulatory protein